MFLFDNNPSKSITWHKLLKSSCTYFLVRSFLNYNSSLKAECTRSVSYVGLNQEHIQHEEFLDEKTTTVIQERNDKPSFTCVHRVSNSQRHKAKAYISMRRKASREKFIAPSSTSGAIYRRVPT